MDKLIERYKKVLAEGKKKSDIARLMAKESPSLQRSEFIYMLTVALEMKEGTAKTYYRNYIKPLLLDGCSDIVTTKNKFTPFYDEGKAHVKLDDMNNALNGVITEDQINIALPKVKVGLDKYEIIQALYESTNVSDNRDFQRKFNGFYKVRRGQDWQKPFYELLEKVKEKDFVFEEVLDELSRSTGRFEASFSSKLLATVNPDKAILDSWVLKNLGLNLPNASSKNRKQKIVNVFETLESRLLEILNSDIGVYLVDRFTAMYPKSGITKIKMLDLVLWQIR